ISSATSVIYTFFFFNDPATTDIYTLSLHDALPICGPKGVDRLGVVADHRDACPVGLESVEDLGLEPVGVLVLIHQHVIEVRADRSEEHTSELQSLAYLVCRLLLEKKKKKNNIL